MRRICQTAPFVTMLLVLGLAAHCGAAILTDLDSVVPPGTGSGMLSLPIFTFDPNMDGAAGDNSSDNNSLFYDLVFDQTGPLDAQFRAQNNTGGGTEYAVLANVANQTGADWVAFEFELGFGAEGNFVQSGADGLSFDTDETNPLLERNFLATTSPVFITYEQYDNRFIFSDGVLPSGSNTFFLLALDVPDADLIPGVGSTAAEYLFTVRHRPLTAADLAPPIPESNTGLIAFVLTFLTAGLHRPQRKLQTGAVTFR